MPKALTDQFPHLKLIPSTTTYIGILIKLPRPMSEPPLTLNFHFCPVRI